MTTRWLEAFALTVAALGLMAAGWAAAGAVRGPAAGSQSSQAAPADPLRCWPARTLGGCATDSECAAAEAAAAEAVEFERTEARARAEFADKCAAGQVPCLKR
jgi:hypothetical protein